MEVEESSQTNDGTASGPNSSSNSTQEESSSQIHRTVGQMQVTLPDEEGWVTVTNKTSKHAKR